jgi:hypothetical protein
VFFARIPPSLGIATLLAFLGCHRPDPNAVVEPLESTLGTAVPAAFIAASAMASLGGTPAPCTSVSAPGGSDGGQVQVNVRLGPGCPSPFLDQGSGTMVVTGVWTPTLATFLADFTQVVEGPSQLLVLKIGVMTVVPQGTHLTVAYLQQDVEAASGATSSAALAQTAWALDVDTRGTPDPTDDILTVSGGNQSLLASAGAQQQASVNQVAVADTVFNAGCRKNPNSGLAAVQAAGTTGGGWMLFTFHSACDGKVDVTAATAPYELMLGESVPLDFLN